MSRALSRSLFHQRSYPTYLAHLQSRTPSRRSIKLSSSPSSPSTPSNSKTSSSSNTDTKPTHDPNKPITLPQPDKFRPPSHGQRLPSSNPNRRRTVQPSRHYGPALTQADLAAQSTKRYPNSLPGKGTRLHWFMNARWLHALLSLGILTILGLTALIQNFLSTSPFSHLFPPASAYLTSPFTSLRETLQTLKLHQDYRTELSGQLRRSRVLDVQKQRLYRRAHGLEDLDAEEEQGVDVRGLVPWDDGLTKGERASGGRDEGLTRRMIHEMAVKDERGEWGKAGDVRRRWVEEEREGREGKGVGGEGGVSTASPPPDSTGDERKGATGDVEAKSTTAEDNKAKDKKVGNSWLGIWG